MAPEPSASSAYSDDGWYPEMDPDLKGTSSPSQSARFTASVKPLQILLRSNHDLRFAYSAILRGDAMLYAFDADPEHPSNFLEADPDPPLPSERAVWATRARCKSVSAAVALRRSAETGCKSAGRDGP